MMYETCKIMLNLGVISKDECLKEFDGIISQVTIFFFFKSYKLLNKFLLKNKMINQLNQN